MVRPSYTRPSSARSSVRSAGWKFPTSAAEAFAALDAKHSRGEPRVPDGTRTHNNNNNPHHDVNEPSSNRHGTTTNNYNSSSSSSSSGNDGWRGSTGRHGSTDHPPARSSAGRPWSADAAGRSSTPADDHHHHHHHHRSNYTSNDTPNANHQRRTGYNRPLSAAPGGGRFDHHGQHRERQAFHQDKYDDGYGKRGDVSGSGFSFSRGGGMGEEPGSAELFHLAQTAKEVTKRPSSAGRSRAEYAALDIGFKSTEFQKALMVKAPTTVTTATTDRRSRRGRSASSDSSGNRRSGSRSRSRGGGKAGAGDKKKKKKKNTTTSSSSTSSKAKPQQRKEVRPGSGGTTRRPASARSAASATSARSGTASVGGSRANGKPRTVLSLSDANYNRVGDVIAVEPTRLDAAGGKMKALTQAIAETAPELACTAGGRAYLRTARAAAIDMAHRLENEQLESRAAPHVKSFHRARGKAMRALRKGEVAAARRWLADAERFLAPVAGRPFDRCATAARAVEELLSLRDAVLDPPSRTATSGSQTAVSMFDPEQPGGVSAAGLFSGASRGGGRGGASQVRPYSADERLNRISSSSSRRNDRGYDREDNSSYGGEDSSYDGHGRRRRPATARHRNRVTFGDDGDAAGSSSVGWGAEGDRNVSRLASSFATGAIERAMERAFAPDTSGAGYQKPFAELYESPSAGRGGQNGERPSRRRPDAPQPRLTRGTGRWSDEESDDFIADDDDDEYNVVDEVTGKGPLPVRPGGGGGAATGDGPPKSPFSESPRGSRRPGVSAEAHRDRSDPREDLYASAIDAYKGTHANSSKSNSNYRSGNAEDRYGNPYADRHVHHGSAADDETMVVPGRGRVRATAPEGSIETVTNALCNHPLFKHLSRREIERAVSHADGIRTVTFPVGTVITRQGDMSVGSGSMYVIDTGECDAVVDSRITDTGTQRLKGEKHGEQGRYRSDDDGYDYNNNDDNDSDDDYNDNNRRNGNNGGGRESGVRSTRLFPGDSFNELTLLHAAPPPSSVTAATPVRLWAVDGAAFRQLINGTGSDLDVPGSLRHRRRVRKEWLLSLPILRGLNNSEIATINEALEEEHLRAGTWIVKQGELGERFYLIEQGRCSVRKELAPGMTSTEVTELTSGDYFGEIALLTDAGRRQASVYAVTDCDLLSLDRPSFERLVGPVEDILRRNMREYDRAVRHVENRRSRV